MAKGFTVKTAAPPKTNTDDFDLAAAKELVKGKTIVFCLPGRGVSYIFLKAFVQLCFDIVQSGGAIQISQDYSSMVNFARCKCLGANVLRGPDQVPWDGNLSMIISYGLTLILYLMSRSSIAWYGWINRSQQGGIVPRMERLLPLLIGWRKTISGRTEA